jgi:hypothetical protein
MKYTFQIVDVFSSTPFGGNQPGRRAGLEASILTLITVPITAIVFTRFYHQNRCQMSEPRPVRGDAQTCWHTTRF